MYADPIEEINREYFGDLHIRLSPRTLVLSAWKRERRRTCTERRLRENSQGTPCISSRQRPSTKLGVRPQQGYLQSAVHRPEPRQIADFTFHTYLATKGHRFYGQDRTDRRPLVYSIYRHDHDFSRCTPHPKGRLAVLSHDPQLDGSNSTQKDPRCSIVF